MPEAAGAVCNAIGGAAGAAVAVAGSAGIPVCTISCQVRILQFIEPDA